MHGDRGNASPSIAIQRAELASQRRAALSSDGVEHRLQFAGRAADDLQDLAGRGLLLQRLGELARARLQLLEQPHVLDRDHRLVGEGLTSSICLSVNGCTSVRVKRR